MRKALCLMIIIMIFSVYGCGSSENKEKGQKWDCSVAYSEEGESAIILFCALGVASTLMALNATGWDNVGYIFFAIYAALMILMCGIGWGIWAIVNIKRKRSKSL